MAGTGTAPVIPPQFQQYNTYVEDPKWQIKFTIVWVSVVGAAIIYSIPKLVHALRTGRILIDFFGVYESWDLSQREPKPSGESTSSTPRIYSDVERRDGSGCINLGAMLRSLSSVVYWSPPGINLNAGQAFLIVAYIITILICIVVNAPLQINSNRAGFIAISQLPVVFLFATKNSALSLLLGPGNGYEKLNFIHRWSGRTIFLAAAIHGSLWIQNHLKWNLPILGQQKETSGVASFGLLCTIVLTTLKPVRKFFYEAFFFVHTLTFVAFFITICYHTPYATPWIFPPLAFYGLDLLLRLIRMRIKDAYLTPIGTQLTRIRIPYCDAGWTAGQHLRVRIFFGGRVLEAHPLTILSAPPSISCLSSPGIYLGARSVGDWTRALNSFATAERGKIAEYLQRNDEKVTEGGIEVPVSIMIDGPYGGSSIDLGSYESAILFAGGSGATFSLGLLDDIVGRCVKQNRPNGERTKRIHFAWCVRSFGSIEWFTPMLMQIATMAANSSLDLYITVYVTCLCNPEAVPLIPNLDVVVGRPSIYTLLQTFTTPPPTRNNSTSVPTPSSQQHKATGSNASASDIVEITTGDDIESEIGRSNIKSRWVGLGGGLAAVASGPGSLTIEASNAVARLSMTRGRELGGVGLHTELYSL